MSQPDGSQARIKINHYGPAATFHEVLAANVMSMLGVPHSPKVRIVAHPTQPEQIGIESTMVDGFVDWGRFLIEHGEEHAGENQKAYREQRTAYSQATEKIAKFESENPQLRALLTDSAKVKTGRENSAKFEDIPSQYRAALREQLSAQDAMLKLLPQRFQTALNHALFTNEIVGNWDFANHARANAGFVILKNKLEGAITVDFGNSGHNGFGGKLKETTPDTAINLPARVDNPFHPTHPTLPNRAPSMPPLAHSSSSTITHRADSSAPTRPGAFDPRIFRQLPLGFGQIGHLPRSEAFARLMEAPLATLNFNPDHIPDGAYQAAYRVSSLPEGALKRMVTTLHHSLLDHENPTIKNKFSQTDLSLETVVADYEARFKAMKERIGTERLAAWSKANPVTAGTIASEVEKGMKEAGLTAERAFKLPRSQSHHNLGTLDHLNPGLLRPDVPTGKRLD